MCMECFQTLSEIEHQKKELSKSRDYENRQHCGNCQDWTEDTFRFCVFGSVFSGLPKGRNHVCGGGLKKEK